MNQSITGAVKAVGPYAIRGRGIVYGGTDLTGDRFTKQTDLGETRSFIGMPVYYDHALGNIRSQIGTVKAWERTDDGIDVDIEIDRRKSYVAEVMELAKRGMLGLSTGALSHLVVREDGELKRWIVGEISLTPTPAEPRTNTEVKAEKDAARAAAASMGPDDISTQSIPGGSVKDQIKQALIEIAGEPVRGGVIDAVSAGRAPATKNLTTNGSSNEPVEALKHFIRTGDHIAAKAVLVEGTNNYGGYLVPKDLYDTIIGRRDQLSIVGKFPVMRITTSRRQVDVPAQDAKADFAIVAESGSANQSEPDFANTKTVTVYRHNMLMKVSNELLADQAANLDAFLQEEIARAYARNLNNYIIAGTGSSQPYGVLARATQSVTLATATTITAANVISIAHAIPGWYRQTGENGWVMQNSTLAAIRSLQGNFFSFGPTPGATGEDLYGSYALVSDKIDAMATTKKSVIYGNWRYYAFVENQQMEIARNPYLYMANNQTGIFVDVRWGGDVSQPEAFAYGVNP